jgi:hypothetical protein
MKRDFDPLLTESATLERPVATQTYSTFDKFLIEEGRIKVSPDAKPRVVTPSEGMLEEFIKLADDTDENRYLRYANKWGVLELCKEHLEPTSHNYNCEPIIPFRTIVLGTTKKVAEEHRDYILSQGEPISAWRHFARFARALLNITANLYQGEMGSDEDWHTLHADEAGFLGVDYPAKRREAKVFPDLDYEKGLIADGVSIYWLGSGAVQPRVSWKGLRPIVSFECRQPYGKLYANLAIQLMMSISQLESIAICSACGQSYMPKRRPKEGQRRYCLNCKVRKIPQRDAAADYRDRKQR